MRRSVAVSSGNDNAMKKIMQGNETDTGCGMGMHSKGSGKISLRQGHLEDEQDATYEALEAE